MKILKGWRTLILNLVLVIAGVFVQFTGVAAPDAIALIESAVNDGLLVAADSGVDAIDIGSLQQYSSYIGDKMGYAMIGAGLLNMVLRFITDTKIGNAE